MRPRETAPPKRGDKPLFDDRSSRRDAYKLYEGSQRGLYQPSRRIWRAGTLRTGTTRIRTARFHPGRAGRDCRSRRGGYRADAATRSGKPRPVLSQESLLAQARKYGYWPFRLCFEEAASSDRAVKGGATLMRVRVGANGRVLQTRVLESELTDADVPPCLARRFERLRFTPAPARSSIERSDRGYPGDAPCRAGNIQASPASAAGDRGSYCRRSNRAQWKSGHRARFTDALAREQKLWGA